MNKKAREKEFRRVMTRRSLLLGGMQLGIASFLGLRLYQLQVAQNSRYSRLSDRNQFDVKIVAPQRGRVFDRKMRLLAGNAESYQLRVTPLHAKDLPQVLDDLSTIIELKPREREEVIAAAVKNPSFRPIVVRGNLTQRELARLAVRSAYLPGGTFEKVLRRIYPQGALTGHVTGYVSPLTSRELDLNPALQ